MRSFRSLAFLRPPKAILVPGMYFLGFSRYSNCVVSDGCAKLSVHGRAAAVKTYESLLVPLNTLLLVGVRVGESVNGTGLASEEAVKVRADLVALAFLQVMALSASGLRGVRSVFENMYGKRVAVQMQP